MATPRPQATLIISVYRDIEALAVIFHALQGQADDLEILVSEDGEDPAMAQWLQGQRGRFNHLSHLTQSDRGFRKNRALNRAILAAQGDYLIFIDGDCVPHHRFIAAHLQQAQNGWVCSGRRVELGKSFSQQIRLEPDRLRPLERPLHYLLAARALHRDRIKNYEMGFYSPWLQRLAGGRHTRLLGCNFSCHRETLLKVNGFNEEFEAAGIGEDSDLDWRLQRSGARIKNIKYSAIQWHLYHQRGYEASTANQAIMERTQAADEWFCRHGIHPLPEADA